MRLELSFATRINERVRPLVEGSVQPAGIDLVPLLSHPGETFWRQLRFGDFDASEMSLSSYLMAKSRSSDLVAIPAFPSRRFFHIELEARADAEVNAPGDLRGKRIGVPEYQQTAAVWMRAVLQHDFDVAPQSMNWFMVRGDALSHAGATGLAPPPGISLVTIPPDQSLVSMHRAGDLDAAFVRSNGQASADQVIERSARITGAGDARATVPAFGDGSRRASAFSTHMGSSRSTTPTSFGANC